MKHIIYLFLLIVLSACLPYPTPQSPATIRAPFIIKSAENPYAPKSEDIKMRIGGVILTSLDIIEQTNILPNRVKLFILGSLPRTCNELRVEVSDPNAQYQIFISIYSLINPSVKCENVFQQFEAVILLGVYTEGRYTIWVNKKLVGDFVSN